MEIFRKIVFGLMWANLAMGCVDLYVGLPMFSLLCFGTGLVMWVALRVTV